jgi:three-Cys-motif partner protein
VILKRCEVVFVFFEHDRGNLDCLHREIEALGELPDGVRVLSYCQDYEAELRRICEASRNSGRDLAPLFAFVDPYGFTLSMDTLNGLLSFTASELLINFMFRYVDMAIQNPAQEENMDRLFGTSDWRTLQEIEDYEGRINATTLLFSQQLRAKFVTHMLMRGANKALKYVLFHASNHPAGREKMKDAMWKVAPEGSFAAYERDRPGQAVLFEADPDLTPLRDALWEDFIGQSVNMERLYDWLLGTPFRRPHLHSVLTDCRRNGMLSFSDYGERFAFKRNPTVSFPAQRPPET